jgi:hypothetical protein
MLGRRLPRQYRGRESTLAPWSELAVDPAIVRRVLGIVADAFGWNESDGLRLRPNDKLWPIYHSYYPRTGGSVVSRTNSKWKRCCATFGARRRPEPPLTCIKTSRWRTWCGALPGPKASCDGPTTIHSFQVIGAPGWDASLTEAARRQQSPRRFGIWIVLENPPDHVMRAVRVASGAQSLRQVETEIAQLRILSKCIAPEFQRDTQLAATSVEHAKVGRDDCAARVCP